MQETRTDPVRRRAIGAEPLPAGVHFRVWAPRRERVEVLVEGGPGAGAARALAREHGGYFSGLVPEARAGSRYRFLLDGAGPFPDPASRFQPEGPHGPSEVVDPFAYEWRDGHWDGLDPSRQVLYELHIGAFTPEGTWAAAARELPRLADLGITTLEVMPVAEFPGRFGWGYDGVALFAPTRLYGRPDELRAFVDAAHGLGLGIILDVVYNHLGPDGCYLAEFSPSYFTDRYENEWGQPLNFDGEDSAPVREFFLENARYWMDEFHLDGLRLDATQQIFDASPVHIIADVGSAVREAARGRTTYLVAENEPQDVRLVRPLAEGGYGLDAIWNDDFHHASRVAATGRHEAYMSDYQGTAQELLSAVKYAFLFQGQRYAWQDKGRGTPTMGVPRRAFVNYLQNHDQVANTPGSRRLCTLSSPAQARALAALLLLGPETPLLFMGEEFGATSPFHYFADHAPELAEKVRDGRREFVSQFAGNTAEGADLILPDPHDPATFESSRLDLASLKQQPHAGTFALHRDLLRIRREDAALGNPLDGAILAPGAFAVRWFDQAGDDRLLVVNLGVDLETPSLAEPLVAPPVGRDWRLAWASEHPAYGGAGQPEPVRPDGWRVPGHSAVLLAAVPVNDGEGKELAAPGGPPAQG